MAKEKFQLEYTINSSPKVLFNRLATAGGLNEWFADEVNVQSDVFTFIWDGAEQKANLVNRKDMKYVRFHWIDDEDDKTYFEFKLSTDELTGDLALIVTDFAEPDEQEDSIELWDTQISELKHIIGS
jgi:uncharacterized protein YndB with AHSA1/START domain